MEILAEPVVSSVLERLGDFFIEEGKFLYGVSGQVEGIQAELRRMQSFLKEADARQGESESVHNWVVQIRDLANDTEDVIEVFVFRVASKRRNILKRYACIFSEGIARHKVGSEIEAIKIRILELTRSLQTYGIRAEEGEGSSSAYQRQLQLRRSYSHVVEDDFVGLEGDVEKLVAHLVDEDKDSYYRLVSIGGMGGLGKTTLAQKVYNHKKVKRHFDAFAWACISQQLQKQDVLQGILIKLIPEKRKATIKMRDEELVRELFQVQRDKKCLVVLDDIWSREAWDSLRHAFPTKETGSKILLTTRNIEVAKHVDPEGFLHEPRFLNDDECWELLQKKAFITRDRTAFADSRDGKSMEELGRKMIKHCGGLPLAVVVLGGLLVTKHTLKDWEMVHQNIDSYISKGKGIGGQQHGGVSQVLALSYSNLPYQLKQCFLYLGNFKEDSEIKVEKLCQMWMAEGLVSLHDRAGLEETMTDVAERYLAELAQRCIVQVRASELTGRFKSCRLHDLMRDLCLSKGEEENFLKVIDFRSSHGAGSSSSPSPSISKIRRLSIYLDKHDNVLPKQDSMSTRHIRSLSFFSCHIGWFFPLRMMRSYFKDFRLLRVLNLDKLRPIKSLKNFSYHLLLGHCNLPKVIVNLVHLQYLSLRGSQFSKLPSSICNLEYLQTLDLRNTNDLVIPNVLWKMGRLTHLYLSTVVNSNKRKLRLDGLRNLETLVYFDSGTCDVKDLFKLTNLRKLRAFIATKPEYLTAMVKYLSRTTGNRLQQSSIEVRDYKFCSEEELTVLRQLVGCHHLNKLYMYGFIKELPEYRDFSPSLNELILSNSELKEDPMATLEQLPNLRSLKLNFDAFVGKEMVCSAKGFPRLKSLSLWRLNNLEKWRVDEGAMPNLSSLQIGTCKNLEKVPDGLEFVSTLQELNIWEMPEAFKNRVRVIDGEKGADFDKVRHVPSITIR